jgi:thiamine-phosphate pyrophosphorylase
MAAAIGKPMVARHSLPRVWLVTDERQGERVTDAATKLPPKSGILLRHYSFDADARRRLLDRLRAVADREGHLLLLAGPPQLAREWGADGWHGPMSGPGLHSASAHDLREIRAREASGAALIFLSPLFPTRSHPGAPTLGPRRFAALAQAARRPVIALGGVGPSQAALVTRLGGYGWGGVDAWRD